MTHTPGPWRLTGPDDFGDYTIQPSSEPLAIAAVTNGAMRGMCGLSDEHAANAKLIAAAPDLLSACESALDQFEAMARDVDTNPWCEELRAAIKKARGEA